MLPTRFIRLTAIVVIILMAAAVILGYDYHHNVNFMETPFSPDKCF